MGKQKRDNIATSQTGNLKNEQSRPTRKRKHDHHKPSDHSKKRPAAFVPASSTDNPSKKHPAATEHTHVQQQTTMASSPPFSSLCTIANCPWTNRTGIHQLSWSSSSNKPRRDLVTCHMCQHHHTEQRCANDACQKSYCHSCCKHYLYLFSAPTQQNTGKMSTLLQRFCNGECPCCLDICLRRRCLRKPGSGSQGRDTALPPVPTVLDNKVMALHVIHRLKGSIEDILGCAEEIARKMAKQSLEELTQIQLAPQESVRLLCNRCAMTLEVACASCPKCHSDFCPSCCAELLESGRNPSKCIVCCRGTTQLKRIITKQQLCTLRSIPVLTTTLAQQKAPELAYYDTDAMMMMMMHGQSLAETSSKKRNAKKKSTSENEMWHVDLPPQDVRYAAIDIIPLPAEKEGEVKVTKTGAVVDSNRSMHIVNNKNKFSQGIGTSASAPIHSEKAMDAQHKRNFFLWTPHMNDFSPYSPRYSETMQRFSQRWSSGEPIIIRGLTGRLNWGPDIVMRAARDMKNGKTSFDVIDCSKWETSVYDGKFLAFSTMYKQCDGRTTKKGEHTDALIHTAATTTKTTTATNGSAPRSNARRSPRMMANGSASTNSTKIAAAAPIYPTSTAPHPNSSSSSLLPMLKLKDFPPEDTFANRCCRHHHDFLEMLNDCLSHYAHPTDGMLNLATSLPGRALPPDLGPKGYIAFGREIEHAGVEGDSVTRLHLDLGDAINVLCHTQIPMNVDKTALPPARCGNELPRLPGYGYAGALWDIYRREDVELLREFLMDIAGGKLIEVCPPCIYKGKIITMDDVNDAVYDQSFMLTEQHRKVLAEQYGVRPWVFEQYEWEAVMIPAGCAHQVRNLRSCTKIAVDFVSPESAEQCLQLREEIRKLSMKEVPEEELGEEEDPGKRHFNDKLQVGNMVIYSVLRAISVLESGYGGDRGHKKMKKGDAGSDSDVVID